MSTRLMPSRRARLALPSLGVAATGLALVVSGCGSGSSSKATAAPSHTTASSASSTANQATKVAVAHSKLGRILVDGQGRTLYVFSKDKGTASSCSGACAGLWPALTTHGAPKAGTGVSAAKLGTTKRADGTTQVTYAGHPLYRFAGDKHAGQTAGQGLNDFGGLWSAVAPTGSAVHKSHHSKRASHAAAAPGTQPAPASTTPAQTAPAPMHTTPTPTHTTPAPMPTKPAPMHAPPPAQTPSGIPQGGGGDHDGDNSGGPSDGDGNI